MAAANSKDPACARKSPSLYREGLGTRVEEGFWCPNSCTQPQLASAGIVVSKLVAGDVGNVPRFDLYRRSGLGMGEKVREQLTFDELTEAVRAFEA